MTIATLVLFGAGCTAVSTTPTPEAPVDTDVSEDTAAPPDTDTDVETDTDPVVDTDDTNDTGWPDAFGNCLTSTMVQALGYTSGFADLASIEERSQTECIRSWRCTSTPDRRGFVEEIAECDGGAYFDDDVGLVATWHTDDTAEVCYAYWTGMVVTDCPLPANATQSVGCVANVPGPATPTVQAGVPSGPATPAQLTADHPCHAQATCDVGLGVMTVFSTSQGGDGYPDVFVYEGSNLVASGDAGVWVGPEATVPCLDVVRTPSGACGLAP